MGGLANRMRVIASALWLKEKLHRGLIVIWNENNELNCPFSLLFEDQGIFTIRKKAWKYNYIKSSIQSNLTTKIRVNLANALIGVDYCIQEQDFHNLIWHSKLDLVGEAKKTKTIYIQTCQEFGDNLPFFKCFRPIMTIREKIENTTKKFSANTIGVHIRRTDNSNAIEFSPIGLFIDWMKAELHAQKNINFFLSSDDPTEEKAILEIFGDKIITYKKELSRQTIQGSQDAVVDLFCLSKTHKIIGSYYSSFSEIAARINNAGLKVIKINS
jgi:hypothetical protein